MENPNYITQTVFITPEMAKQMLENLYEKQRNVKWRRIDFYKSDILNGYWNPYAASPIIVSDKGSVLDGQHRLIAIIEADKGIWAEIRSNVPESTYKTIDSGCARSTGDNLDGRNKKVKAAIAKTLLGLTRGVSINNALNYDTHTTKAQETEYALYNSDEIETITDQVLKIRRIIGKGYANALCIPIAIMNSIDPDVVDYFIEEITSDKLGDRRVMAYIQAAQSSVIKNNYDKYRQFTLLMKTLEAINNDAEVKRFTMKDGYIQKWEKYVKENGIILS